MDDDSARSAVAGKRSDRNAELNPNINTGTQDGTKQTQESANLVRRSTGRKELEAMIDAEFADENRSGTNRRVILIDGFNVLHAVLLKAEREAGWWKRKQRERLLQRVCEWPIEADEIWVAFDGTQPAWSVWAEPVAKVIQSRSGSARSPAPGLPARAGRVRSGPILHSVYVESADDWIVRRARRTSNPKQTVVVSADRQVAGRARSAGCEVWTPWTFMSQLPSPDAAAPEDAEPDRLG